MERKIPASGWFLSNLSVVFDHTPEVLIGSFSRFRRFYWIILMTLSVIFRGDSFCAFGAILLMLPFPIYIIRCKNASGREKGEKMKKNAFFLKILSEKFGGTEKMYYLCTRI